MSHGWGAMTVFIRKIVHYLCILLPHKKKKKLEREKHQA